MRRGTKEDPVPAQDQEFAGSKGLCVNGGVENHGARRGI